MVPDELIGNLGDVHLYSNHVEQAKEQIGRELSFEERLRLVNYDKERFTSIDEWIEWYRNEPEEFYFGGIKYTKETALTDLGVPTRTREPFPLPKLVISNQVNFDEGIDEFLNSCSPDDFKIEGYQSHPTIKMPLSN